MTDSLTFDDETFVRIRALREDPDESEVQVILRLLDLAERGWDDTALMAIQAPMMKAVWDNQWDAE